MVQTIWPLCSGWTYSRPEQPGWGQGGVGPWNVPLSTCTASTLTVPAHHMASPKPRRAAVGRRQGERDKPAPCFEEAGPYAHFGGPRSRPSPLAGHLRCAGEPDAKKEERSEAGPRNLQNNKRGSYSSASCISFPPPPPGPAPAPSRPQQPPAKAGQNQKERVFGRGHHAVAEVSL